MKRDFSRRPVHPAPADRIASLLLERPTLVEEKLKHRTVNGHTLIARSLKGLGVTHVYCVAGTPVGTTFSACALAGIRAIGVHHQQAAVMMATAQNYIAGRVTAAVLVSAGPAVTNAATGILIAKDNCWPVVVLGGRRPLRMRGMGSFQELDAVPIFQPMTKWAALVESTSDIPGALERAFKIAAAGRPGPVYLDLPEDVLTGTTQASELSFSPAGEPATVDVRAVGQAADILSQARRPLLILGKGLRWSQPYAELTRLVNEWGIPFITSPMGRGTLGDDHALCCNAIRGLAQSKADAVLLLGARLDWTFRFGSEIAADAKLIQVDVHAPEIGVNIKPAVGIVGDAGRFLCQLLERLEPTRRRPGREGPASWQAFLSEARRRKERELEARMESGQVPMSPYRMLKEVRDSLPPETICILDGNVSMAAAQQVLPSYLPASRLTAGSNGCMGVGIPFAIGAKLQHPDRPVVCVCGDSAFGFNAMEMETAVRHGIAIVVLVVNNEGIWGALIQKAAFPPNYERVAMFQPGIHYENIMRAFGGHGESVDHPDQLKPALARALASATPACINVRVDPDAPYPRD